MINIEHASFEELDLSIPNMNLEIDESKVGEILRKLPGVEAVRLIEHGAWMSYRPDRVHKDVICKALQDAGFDAATFQDSETGETGASPV